MTINDELMESFLRVDDAFTIAIALEKVSVIQFTFLWKEVQCGEGRNCSVAITGSN
jgi:hypothetical protein